MNRWIRGTNALVFSAALIGIFILLTIMVGAIPGTQFDLTKEKKYTLSEHTLDVLNKVEEDIQIYAFTGSNSMEQQIVDLLEEYARRSNHITFNQVDPTKNPSLAQELGVTQYGTVVFQMGDETTTVQSYQIFAPGNSQQSYFFMGEERFTRTINDFISDEEYPVYFLTGHNEITSGQLSVFYQALQSSRFVPKDLNLGLEGQVPEEAEILLIVGMQRDITAEEADMIRDFMDGGGKLFVAFNYHPEFENWTNISSVLDEYGIKPVSGIVVDPERRFLNNPSLTVPEYGFHTIVNKLQENNFLTVLPTPIPLQAQEEAPEGLLYRELLKTTDEAYAKIDSGQDTLSWNKEEGDLDGPFNMAYSVETRERKPRAIILGSATFLINDMFSQQGNRDFVMNSLAYLNEQENSIVIRPREETMAPQAFLLPDDVNRIFYSTVAGIPGLFLILAGIVWWRRRKG